MSVSGRTESEKARLESWVAQAERSAASRMGFGSHETAHLDELGLRYAPADALKVALRAAVHAQQSASPGVQVGLALHIGDLPSMTFKKPALGELTLEPRTPPSLYVFLPEYFLAGFDDSDRIILPYDDHPWREYGALDVHFSCFRDAGTRREGWEEFSATVWVYPQAQPDRREAPAK